MRAIFLQRRGGGTYREVVGHPLEMTSRAGRVAFSGLFNFDDRGRTSFWIPRGPILAPEQRSAAGSPKATALHCAALRCTEAALPVGPAPVAEIEASAIGDVPDSIKLSLPLRPVGPPCFASRVYLCLHRSRITLLSPHQAKQPIGTATVTRGLQQPYSLASSFTPISHH